MSPTSQNRRRRGRSRRRALPTERSRPGGSWELHHSPYTAEGRIEGAYRFAVGARNVTGWKRRVLVGFGLLFLVGIGLALVIAAIDGLIRWLR